MPMVETKRRGHEYYLRPILDALEAAITPRQWDEQKSMLFENNLGQMESFTAMVSFEFILASLGMSANVTSDQDDLVSSPELRIYGLSKVCRHAEGLPHDARGTRGGCSGGGQI